MMLQQKAKEEALEWQRNKQVREKVRMSQQREEEEVENGKGTGISK